VRRENVHEQYGVCQVKDIRRLSEARLLLASAEQSMSFELRYISDQAMNDLELLGAAKAVRAGDLLAQMTYRQAETVATLASEYVAGEKRGAVGAVTALMSPSIVSPPSRSYFARPPSEPSTTSTSSQPTYSVDCFPQPTL
jgi:hypothetical protein